MKILNKDRDSYVENWMNCSHKKIVLNKGSESCDLTEEGLKRFADIKSISVDLLIDQLNIYKGWGNEYVVHHSKIQCDPDFIYLVENNSKDVIFSNEDYKPVVQDLSNYKSTDKFIVVYEQGGYEGMMTYKETLYDYNTYMDINAKVKALYNEIYNLKDSLKEVM